MRSPGFDFRTVRQMIRIYTKEIGSCGYQCPSYSCEQCECGGGDYQYCDLYKKEIYGNIIVDGFPTFCKLSSKKSDMVDWDRPIGNPFRGSEDYPKSEPLTKEEMKIQIRKIFKPEDRDWE